jgi:hypothetical protein
MRDAHDRDDITLMCILYALGLACAFLLIAVRLV